jgi:hypothetical protein
LRTWSRQLSFSILTGMGERNRRFEGYNCWLNVDLQYLKHGWPPLLTGMLMSILTSIPHCGTTTLWYSSSLRRSHDAFVPWQVAKRGFEQRQHIHLLLVLDKDERADLSNEERTIIRGMVTELKKVGGTK